MHGYLLKYKAELFVNLLPRAFILNPIYPKGTPTFLNILRASEDRLLSKSTLIWSIPASGSIPPYRRD